MATVLQVEGQLSQILQCPICLETLKSPKVLPCGHTYCASCLQSHINSKVTQRGTAQASFPCPVCRADTTSLSPNISVEQWAESFPVNSIVSSLMDVTLGRNGNKFCDQCGKRERETPATCFCKPCNKSMCTACKEFHDDFPALSQHEVININNDSGFDCVMPNFASIEACPRHSVERIKFFCSDHSTLCCNTCGFLEHRKCERVVTVDDMMKTFDINMKSKEVEANLAKFKDHLKQITHKIKENNDTIKKDKADILQQIHSFKDQMIARLQKLEEDAVNYLESNYKSENFSLQMQETEGQSLITAIDSDRTQLELVMKHGSEVQKVILIHNLDRNQQKYFLAVSEYQKEIKDVRLTLVIDKTLQTLVSAISELGKINLIHTKFDISPCPEISIKESKAVIVSGSSRTPLRDRKAVNVADMNVRILGDTETCRITDIMHLSDTRILMVDYSNYKIKMFGQDYKYQECMAFQDSPWSACCLSDTEIVVTFPSQKTIQVIGIKDKMYMVRKIKTRLSCCGIAVMKDQLVITTYDDRDSVLILDMDGKEIRTFQPHGYESDKLLKPFYVKVDTTYLTMYISYETVHKLVTYNMNWDILSTYTNRDLKSAAGMDTDREGNIYLCGFTSKCIQQISAEGNLIKTIVSKKEEKKNPLTISFFKNMDRFIVTYGICDVVEVYDLCA